MNRSTHQHRHRSLLTAMVVGGVVALMLPATAAESTRTASRQAAAKSSSARTVVDAAVRPAGGMACHECGPTGCRHGKLCHHRDCKDGVCVPYCPVRPGTFGYYGTQWRRWPGQGVVPVSNVEAATPVKPPKSEVPGVDEESFGPKADDLPEPAAPEGAADESPARPMAPEPDSPAAPEPTVPESGTPAAEPRAMPLESAEPPSKPAAEEAAPAKPKADDLFDESAALRVRRKIPVHSSAVSSAPAGTTSGVTTTSHEAPRPSLRPVPRVAFDPRAESARLREAR